MEILLAFFPSITIGAGALYVYMRDRYIEDLVRTAYDGGFHQGYVQALHDIGDVTYQMEEILEGHVETDND